MSAEARFRVGDKVRRTDCFANCGVEPGDERVVQSVHERWGWLCLDDGGGHDHDPDRYELVESMDIKQVDGTYLNEIAEFCLGKGIPYNHDHVMQYLEEGERWRKAANNFRSDASIIMQGGEPQTGLPNRTASREVYAEVLEALKDHSKQRENLVAAGADILAVDELNEDLIEDLRDERLAHGKLQADLRDALGCGFGVSIERMLEMVKERSVR